MREKADDEATVAAKKSILEESIVKSLMLATSPMTAFQRTIVPLKMKGNVV